ncbi:hypothetical protein O6H91_09G034800 [Diphasiastrum complanatum]|uniref:Uncharacterized protein n=1 Tax=Diphasiastrum complanatum TaxID=34168 RepID=A0ACC2CMY7_DIPCM|nr:hypothetical protein O6H91_09G034800 [Diphasiastrum complanatum]
MGSEKKLRSPLLWVKRQSIRVKVVLGVLASIAALVFLKIAVVNHNYMFIASEAIHTIGIIILIYKLQRKKSCAGLSLRSQELTALFLIARLYCSVIMEHNIHTILDFLTLITTAWVIYMIRFKLKSTYMEDLDTLRIYYVFVPCAILALIIQPTNTHHVINRTLWAFCVYLESVSVLPQLRIMQNAKVVEPFTANYVFALGVARFLNCAHWILQLYDDSGSLLRYVQYGRWAIMVCVSEVVQTFVLADFCYYYVKSVIQGQTMVRLPSGVV